MTVISAYHILRRRPGALILPAAVAAALFAPLQSAAILPATDPLLCAEDPGYIARGRAMSQRGNWQGAIDQLGRVATEAIPLTEAEAEEWIYLLANAFYNTADPRCEQYLNDFIASYPASARSVNARLLLGDYYFFSHNFSSALTAYNEIPKGALDADREARYSYRRALCMIKCGLFDEARPLLKSLLAKKEYREAAAYYDAYIDYVKGDLDQAYDKFTRLSGKSSRRGATLQSRANRADRVVTGDDLMAPEYYICQILFARGEWRETAEKGSALLASHPVETLANDTRRVVGLSLYRLDDLDAARGYLERYVAEAGDNAADDARYALGVCLYDDGEEQKAREIFSLLTGSSDAIAQGSCLYLGQIAAAEGNPSSAAINFEKAYRMNYDPKVAEAALYNYIAAKMRGGNIPFDTSIELMERFAEMYPRSEYAPAVDRSLAEAWYSRGDYGKALQCINRIPHPDAATIAARQRILYGAGTSAVTDGDYSRGARLLDECVAAGGGNRDLLAQASVWLGDARYHLEEYPAAEKAYSRALDYGLQGVSRQLAIYDLAYARLMQDKFEAASKGFAQVAGRNRALPSDLVADARLRLADCKYYMGDYAGALSDFSALVKEGINADYASLRTAQVMGARGDVRGKIKTLEEIERKYPDSRWLADALSELGDTYAAEGNQDKAAAAYERMLRKYPEGKDSAKAWYQLATNLLSKGDRAGALDAFRHLEQTGDTDYMADAYAGIMRSSDDRREQLRYAEKVRSAGGLDAEIVEEASYIEAVALLDSRDAADRRTALDILHRLAANPQSLYGARSAVAAASYMLDNGNPEETISAMEEFTSSGSPHSYWVARGFILLADAYEAKGDTILALDYLHSLRSNYPGRELDIHDMISKRIKRLEK